MSRRIESTIVSFLRDEPVILRPGVITSGMLAEVLGRPVLSPEVNQSLPRGHRAAMSPITRRRRRHLA